MPQADPFDGLLTLARHTPIPTINGYITISVLLAGLSLFSSKFKLLKEEMIDPPNVFSDSPYFDQIYNLLLHPKLGWVYVNTFCAMLALIARVATHIAVGDLNVQESLLLRDRICYFLLYKAIFLFGVLNTVVHEEITGWVLWFALLGTVAALQSIAAYKLKYAISSVPSRKRLLGFSVLLLVISMAFFSFALTALRFFTLSIALFLLADAFKLFLRSIYILCKCVLSFDSISTYIPSITLSAITYYLELAHDLTIDAVDLIHCTHMLFYSQAVLSMASVVISLHLRSFFKSFMTRIKQHLKYTRICKHINTYSRKATRKELDDLTDRCAVCWEQMESARKLSCNHFFHEWCLRSWLEQDNSCPTCRVALPSLRNNDVAEGERRHVQATWLSNRVFRFNGARYAHWLPSFSIEFSHNAGPNIRITNMDNLQLTAIAEQVREMFPQLDQAVILEDLQESGSIQATVENILDGRFRHHRDSSFDLEEYNGDILTSSDSSVESSEREDSPSVGESTSNPPFEKRQDILSQRKDALIQYHRKKYIESSRGADLRKLYGKDVPSTSSTVSSKHRRIVS